MSGPFCIFVVVLTTNNNNIMKEEITWVHIIHYYWQNENGEIYDKIWTSKDYRRSKQFFEIRKDMLMYKVRNATIKAKFEKRNYVHVATEEMGFFTLTMFKQKFQ